MTTADKTKQRLVESMRKSKTGAAKKPSATTRATAPKKAAPAKKATPRRTSARQPAKPVAHSRPLSAAAMVAVTWQISTDPYQSDGRIWPD